MPFDLTLFFFPAWKSKLTYFFFFLHQCTFISEALMPQCHHYIQVYLHYEYAMRDSAVKHNLSSDKFTGLVDAVYMSCKNERTFEKDIFIA